MSNFAIQMVAMFFFLRGGNAGAPVGIIGAVILPVIFYFIRLWFRHREVVERNRDGV